MIEYTPRKRGFFMREVTKIEKKIVKENLTILDHKSKNNLYKEIYFYFVKNKYKSPDEFFDGLEQKFSKTVRDDIINIINIIRKNYSSTGGIDMMDIYLYMCAKRNNSNNLFELEEKVARIKARSYFSVLLFENEEHVKKQSENYKNNVANYVEICLDNNEIIKIKNITLTDIKKNLNQMDKEKYLEFMKLYFDFEPINTLELIQYLETLEFFISNLEASIEEISNNNLNTDEDINKIKNSNVCEESDQYILQTYDILKFKNWKMTLMKRKMSEFIKLRDYIRQIINKDDMLNLKNPTIKNQVFASDEEFLCSYYEELRKFINGYKNTVSRLNNISDKKAKDINEEFFKKFVLENNN